MTHPAVGKVFLSFLPHKRDELGLTEEVNATAMNPGFFTPTGVTRDPGLQAVLERRVVNHPQHKNLFAKLRYALVDLTGDKIASPRFAGHRELEQGGLGSMAKTSCMYAAFQLKFDLERLARKTGLTTDTDLFAAARKLWSDTQQQDNNNITTLFPARPKIELAGKLVLIDGKPLQTPPGFGAPDLEQMFEVVAGSSGVSVRFKGSDKILVDPTVPGTPAVVTPEVRNYVRTGGGLAKVRKLSFAERLFLMVDESDNSATHTCIENVSYLYLISSLWQCDLYRPERGGGLWEGSTHDNPPIRWTKPPVPRDSSGTDFVSATGAAIASLITLIEQERLVSPESSQGMKHLMDKFKPNFGSFTRSFFDEGLNDAGLPTIRLHSKLGIANFQNDCAIIERAIDDPANPGTAKNIRYAAAAFDDTGIDGLKKIIVAMDACIRENNGLP